MLESLFIGQKDILQILNQVGLNKFMDDTISSIREAFYEFDPKEDIIKTRDGFVFEDPYETVLEWMPIIVKKEKLLLKLVSYIPSNPGDRNIPTVISQYCMLDAKTGHLIAISDGVLPTAIRTGAASAVATEIMMSKKQEHVLGLVGCGCQAITQIHAISRVTNFKEIYAYDIDNQTVKNFVSIVSQRFNLNVKPSSLEILEKESDIICTTTSVPINRGPVINGRNLKTDVHINAVGADLSNKIELPKFLLKKSFVFPDLIEQALTEGECQQLSREEVRDDIFKVVKSKQKYSFEYRDKSTIFDSTGIPLEDFVAMNLIIKYANKFGLGKNLCLENISVSPKDPYFLL